jgi:hypothetical protein
MDVHGLNYSRMQQFSPSAQSYPGLERLICAALADPDLTVELLADPATALEQAASALQLSFDECALAASISGAADIHDFAARLYAKVQQEKAARR